MKIIEVIDEKQKEIAVRLYIEGCKEQTPPHYCEKKDARDIIENSTVLLARSWGRYVGLLVVMLDLDEEPPAINISFMYSVVPGKGIATKLLKKALGYAHDETTVIISSISEVDERAKRFYLEKCGFKILELFEEHSVAESISEVQADTEMDPVRKKKLLDMLRKHGNTINEYVISITYKELWEKIG